MERFVLTDAQWAKMEPHCLGKPTDPGRSGSDNRASSKPYFGSCGREARGVIFRRCSATGTLFQALPRLGQSGRFHQAFGACSDTPDMEYAMVDATIVKVHRHGQGQKGSKSQAIGRSKGGMTTKILALTDALGNLVRFVLLPGHRFDTVGLLRSSTVSPLKASLPTRPSTAIPSSPTSTSAAPRSSSLTSTARLACADRRGNLQVAHLIENFFCKLKEFKRIAMRADKTDQSFAANIHLAAAVINFR